ncbi:MAG: cytochrome c [Candidatus Korobacteraceae bacterium]
MSSATTLSGQQLYLAYCGACHGAGGKGDGPAASALRTPPTDLTTLAAKNGGSFPEERVYLAAKGESGTSAHGIREMPVWGPAFLAQEAGNEMEFERRLQAVVAYIESLQVSVTAQRKAEAAQEPLEH